MWPRRSVDLLSKLNISSPIIQAPMAGGATTPALVAAVSNSGGLGSLGAGYLSPAELKKAIQDIRKLTTKPFSVNLFVPSGILSSPEEIKRSHSVLNKIRLKLGMKPVSETVIPLDTFQEQINVVIDEGVPIVSFAFGIPSADIVKKLKKREGTVIIGTATTVREGMQIELSGFDIVVAQGSEAGGHRSSFGGLFKTSLIGTMALVPQLVDYVKIPVIAAGGIMDGRGVVAALALGASGVQMGTAFLTCPESGIHSKYKEAILGSNEESTVLTTAFSGKPARGIRNEFMREMAKNKGFISTYPTQHFLTQDIRKESAKQNNIDYMSLWAGQATRLSQAKPAGELVIKITQEALDILHPHSSALRSKL